MEHLCSQEPGCAVPNGREWAWGGVPVVVPDTGSAAGGAVRADPEHSRRGTWLRLGKCAGRPSFQCPLYQLTFAFRRCVVQETVVLLGTNFGPSTEADNRLSVTFTHAQPDGSSLTFVGVNCYVAISHVNITCTIFTCTILKCCQRAAGRWDSPCCVR